MMRQEKADDLSDEAVFSTQDPSTKKGEGLTSSIATIASVVLSCPPLAPAIVTSRRRLGNGLGWNRRRGSKDVGDSNAGNDDRG